MIAAAIASAGAVMAGGANALEDGFEMSSMGTWYVVGFMTAWLAMLPLALAVRLAGFPRLAGAVLLLFAGILLFNAGGGVIVLLALGGLALVPAWFTGHAPSVARVSVEPPIA